MVSLPEPMPQAPTPSPEPRRESRWRRLSRFSLKSLLTLFAIVAAFFAGRATDQRHIDRLRAKAAQHAETFRKARELPARLKPLAIPPGTEVYDGRTSKWSAGPIRLLGNGWSAREGPGEYLRIYEDYFELNVAGTSIPTRPFNVPGERAGSVVNGLLDQLKRQLPNGDVQLCRNTHQVVIRHGLGATGWIELPYGSVYVTAVCLADRKTGVVTDRVGVQVTTRLRADDGGQW